jgi:hypothetical protein
MKNEGKLWKFKLRQIFENFDASWFSIPWGVTRASDFQRCILIFNSFNLDIHRIWNKAKSSAGFRTSAMFKASTTLGFIWDYNTCIVQPPIIKYSSCISCYFVWGSPKRKQSTSLAKRNGAPPPKGNTRQGYEMKD